MPYPDLIAIEATRRLVAERRTWSVPAMNRMLVEYATHPEARAELLKELRKEKAAWDDADLVADGLTFARTGQGSSALLKTDVGFENPAAYFSADDAAATRLGAMDVLVELPEPVQGPFGGHVSGFQLPAYWGIDPTADVSARLASATQGAITFDVQGKTFRYDARGLSLQRD